MFQKFLLKNKSVFIWAIAAGILFGVFAIAPQIDLWKTRGGDWKGSYAITDYDEPFYAAYLQSLVEGKPRRNSPYTGAADSAETPQKESYLSIQFLASYPTAIVARFFGFSLPTTMILLAAAIGFLSAVVFFWLVYLFSRNAPAAFVGTIIILFGGALAAGQGSFFGLITFSEIHYQQSLIFLRRTLPATAFPALFLFFIFVWKFVSAKTGKSKILWAILSVGCFGFNVFSYFYFWTTALAWIFGLAVLWAIFRFEDLRENKFYLAGLAGGLFLPLIPYFILLQNRSTDVDSALVLSFTHQPDLWRVPEIVSYLAIAVFIYAAKVGWVNLRSPKFLFLFSFTLVAPMVFNQQILTGKSLQPFHYQFFCANYIALFSLLIIVFHLLKRKISADGFHKFLVIAGTVMLIIGYFDTMSGVTAGRELNVWRDELMPAAQRIKEISEQQPSQSPTVVFSFDLSNGYWTNGIDIPSLTSQPVLWKLHMTMFPDVTRQENLERMYKFLYFQNFDEHDLREELASKNLFLTYGFFGGDKTSNLFTGVLGSVKSEDRERVISQYGEFRKNFSYENARTPEISLVLVHKFTNNHGLSAIDRWYERDAGETVGEYNIYRVKLRRQ